MLSLEGFDVTSEGLRRVAAIASLRDLDLFDTGLSSTDIA